MVAKRSNGLLAWAGRRAFSKEALAVALRSGRAPASLGQSGERRPAYRLCQRQQMAMGAENQDQRVEQTNDYTKGSQLPSNCVTRLLGGKSTAIQQISASLQQMTAQVEQVVESARSLSEMATNLQARAQEELEKARA